MDIESQKTERLGRIRAALAGQDAAALICSVNQNVLMASGYWPVTGLAVAIVTAEPRLHLLVPEDEHTLAMHGWADQVHTYAPSSLARLESAQASLMRSLGKLLAMLPLQTATLCCESGAGQVMSSYVAQSVLGPALAEGVRQALPQARLQPAEPMLAALRMRPTVWERERIRIACAVAACAFEEGARQLRPGMTETEASLPFGNALAAAGRAQAPGVRSDGFFYCMAGARGAAAHAAFQRSDDAILREGEPILVHCNSYVGGYWTDLTRTYVLGAPDATLMRMFAAIAAAREAAIAVVFPGVPAAAVDRAARRVLAGQGYGEAFCHGAGHGVGFGAIDHEAEPRIHPCADRILEEGMVFNLEPAIYLAGYGGLRDCNMVAVTDHGHALLSPFQQAPADWCLPAPGQHRSSPTGVNLSGVRA